MKRILRICLFAALCALGILLASCGNNEGESHNTNVPTANTENIETTGSAETTECTDTTDTTDPIETTPSNVDNTFYKDYVIDDQKSLDSTKEYDLNELNSFFKTRMRYDSEDGLLSPTFNEVNEQFPVEIIRTGYYSVYRVKQGGYYYVFWIMPMPYDVDGEPLPNFTTYLSSDRSPEMFASITPGVSTVGDVEKIDPNCEIFTLASSGIWVYCYINPETVLAFQCTHYDTDVLNSVVNTVHLISREKSAYFSVIQPKDLP